MDVKTFVMECTPSQVLVANMTMLSKSRFER